jgi:hypothetical protein
MCHENEMGAAKEQHPYIICRLDKQRRWNSGGTVTRPLFTTLHHEEVLIFVERPRPAHSSEVASIIHSS